MGLAAVALVAIGGRAAWAPALRYLFIAVLGSLVYLVGVSLIYARTGTLDMALAGERLAGGQVALSALVRSEERRVGKECRAGGGPGGGKKKRAGEEDGSGAIVASTYVGR